MAVHLYLGIVADAGPAGRCDGVVGIVVAAEQVLGTVEAVEQRRRNGVALRDVAQVSEDVAGVDDDVSPLDHRGVYFGSGREWTALNMMPK